MLAAKRTELADSKARTKNFIRKFSENSFLRYAYRFSDDLKVLEIKRQLQNL